MGLLIRKHITNILDVPMNVLIWFVGRGLKVNREEHPPTVEVDLGEGMRFNHKSQVSFDNVADRSKTQTITQCSNTSLRLDGRKFTLTKIFEDYNVYRNKDGIVLDMVLVGTREEKDEVILTDYGYMSALARPNRKSTPDKPSFYKK